MGNELDIGAVEIALTNMKHVMRMKWDIDCSEAHRVKEMLNDISLYAKITAMNIDTDTEQGRDDRYGCLEIKPDRVYVSPFARPVNRTLTTEY